MERYEEGLQDFNRALVYLPLQQAESAKADLDIAQQEHTEKPDNGQNTFNLMLGFVPLLRNADANNPTYIILFFELN
ncbi:hypothetical protein H6G54_00295 [Anabaena cylindrica FACHB-243]|uniref:Uncharacterized protein n=1 Tax=Anabaena cylindrica (strain ATCC 27899 / PCC 7122) TaxID=272123 RepID=K9ZDH0_ANACC|nr:MULTISPECIES: hypothetical protein [Anabaena]AFZ56652.1 hypothetical protein Anacy_1080 [Anabaena cylindrica PCC 7122]MBD2416177.1 hypothetical protein [Anabaena cylindrica FACHB-243]MBY5285797.1 hypothetical protein [Anabaena sp. CCAP 1446/1C]MBY5311751.1 hypothetical protein [Anabaena sp. CCAP 1446/1C]MCM2408659.1 hypothetical protein [Anabaena sp. CCAP 1446/1C]